MYTTHSHSHPAIDDPVARRLLRQLRRTSGATLAELEVAARLPPHAGLLALTRLLACGRVVGLPARLCRVSGMMARSWAAAGDGPVAGAPGPGTGPAVSGPGNGVTFTR